MQASGPPRGALPVELPGKPRTFVIPLVADETLHGIVVLQECARPLDPVAERELIALGTTMSLTLHTLSLRSQLAKAVLPEQVEEAITQERRRIAREIHDGVAQSLAYLNLKTELLDRLVERNPAAAREQAAVVRQLLQTAMTELRRCIGDLRRPASGHGPAITAQLAYPGELTQRDAQPRTRLAGGERYAPRAGGRAHGDRDRARGAPEYPQARRRQHRSRRGDARRAMPCRCSSPTTGKASWSRSEAG